ncbi:hypothetical protein Dalk_0969 [Desulfatibacillum aliphaticivorans]|uniref:Uncharacterized protein n=1 Tax=Desulfatibacillum aliphaticivorans TaxID=218208 RepID=B8FIA5_DESAL|nr:hypothetical protein [Desulfatibacillum aliphaticivorans]ACL02672.1 hypothetical protein Dalk_0969 [Desulfatibacillum aliphaticivorans]
MKKDKPFKKVPGGGKNILAPSYLWMAKDHLLCVNTTLFYDESYRRFFFKDIQAIFFQKTISGFVWMGFYLFISLLMGWGVVSGGPQAAAALLTPLFIFILLLVRRIYLWGSCKFWIQTESGVELIKSVNSRRRAKQLLAQLRPLIEQAQGGKFDPETLNDAQTGPTIDQGGLFEAARRKRLEASGQNYQAQKQTAPIRRQFHKPLYVLTLISGCFSLSEFAFHSLFVDFIGMFVSLFCKLLVVVALVRQTKTDLPASLKNTTWVTGGLHLVLTVLSYVVLMMVFVESPDIAGNHWLLFKALSEMPPDENTFLLVYSITHIAGSFVLGALGLTLTLKYESPKKIIESSSSISSASTSAPVSEDS